MRGRHHHGATPGRDAERPGDIPPRGVLAVLRRVRRELKDDHTSLFAAGVAFYGFLAAVPALAALVSIYALFADPARIEARVRDLLGSLPDDAQALLTEQLHSIAGQSGGALGTGVVVGIALSLWSASSGMAHLVEAINLAYDEVETRGALRRRLLALLLTVGAVVFVLVAVVAIGGLPAIVERAGLARPVRTAIELLSWPVLAVAFAVALAVLYRTAGDRAAPRWRWVTWGSAAAVMLWIAASIAFRIYASRFGSYNETYGSLAAVVVLLLWLDITAFAVLLGAQVNAELEHQTARDTTTGPPRPLGERDAVMADSVADGS